MQSPSSSRDELPATAITDVRPSLRDLLRAIDAAKDVRSAVRLVAAWAREDLGTPDAGVRVSLPDVAGRLRAAWSDREIADGGRKRSARRRVAYLTGTPHLYDLTPSGTNALGVLPLVASGETLGVLEIVGPREPLQERWGSLELVARGLGTSVYLRRNEERIHRELTAVRDAVAFAGAVSTARSSEAALRAAARFVSTRLDVPVAAWSAVEGRADLELVDVRGLGVRRRREVRAAMPSVRRSEDWTAGYRADLVAAFCELADVRHAEVVDARDAVIMMGSSSSPSVVPLGVVGSVLEEALRRRSGPVRRLDVSRRTVGIAWAAHELRAPLLAVRAALEVTAIAEGLEERDRRLLARSMAEVEQLADLVEDILGWSGGGTLLRPTSVDLVSLVNDVLERSKLETGEDRVVLHAPEHAIARVDATHMRTAIGNLVRNALAYAAPGTKIEVTVERGAGWVQIAVRDQGPPLSREDGASIFEAFVRGDGAARNRAGSGLGLFVAERVVSAHGGRIWFEPTQDGTIFFIRLGESRPRLALA